MRERILRLLILHLSFTKFIFIIYYSYIIRCAIAAITLKNGMENTISGFGGKDAFTGQGDGHLLDGGAKVEAASYVQAARGVIANLE